MKRLDQFLVDSGLAPSRSKAQQMILAQEVQIFHLGEWRDELSPSRKIDEARPEHIRIKPSAQTLKYVSRGGLKLESALKHLQLDASGWLCLDVGQSTGGFTDALLQFGARRVVGFDVGHDQLHPQLKADARVIAVEGLHVRDLKANATFLQHLEQGPELTVVDVSFISLAHVLPVLAEILPHEARLLALVKPQFEVGPEKLGKGGVVTDEKLFSDVQTRLLLDLKKCGFTERDYFPCAVRGQDGNQEFFVYAVRDGSAGIKRLPN